MKNITITMIALCVALVSGAALAKSTRIEITHKPGTAAERTITISVSALPAHCRHGDEIVDEDSVFSCDDGDDGDGLIQVCDNGSDDYTILRSELDDFITEHAVHAHSVQEGECLLI